MAHRASFLAGGRHSGTGGRRKHPPNCGQPLGGSTAVQAGASYTDGAGAEQWVPRETARVGAGAAAFTWKHNKKGEVTDFGKVSFTILGVHGPQTVPRAETIAALKASQALRQERATQEGAQPRMPAG